MDQTSPHDGAKNSQVTAQLEDIVPNRTTQSNTELTAFTSRGASDTTPNLLDIMKDNGRAVLSGRLNAEAAASAPLQRTGDLLPSAASAAAGDTKAVVPRNEQKTSGLALDLSAAQYLAAQGRRSLSSGAYGISMDQAAAKPGIAAAGADVARAGVNSGSSFFNGRLSEQGTRLIVTGSTESLIHARPQSALPNWKPRELNLGNPTSSAIASETERFRAAEAAQAARAVDVAFWRKNLSDAFRGQDQSKLADFERAMTNFETRARGRGLPESEIAATYREVSKVLGSAHAASLCKTSKLAFEIIRNAADPTKIDQGQHPTCNVNSYECKLYATEPAQAARLVASVATTGSFTCADGTVIRPRSLKPDDEASKEPVPDGSRNYASQLFQNTAINIYWNRRETLPDLTRAGKGNIQYCQSTDKQGEAEFLLDCSKDPPKYVSFFLEKGRKSSPRIGQDEISDINEQVTGRPTKDQGIEKGRSTYESRGILYVEKVEDFKATLSRIRAQKGFPILLGVDAAMKPFADGADADTSFRPHLVTITDFDEEKGLVAVDNQWGSYNDHTGKPGQKPLVPVDELFASMRLNAPNRKDDDSHSFGTHVKERLQSTTLSDAGKVAAASLSSSLFIHATLGNMDWHVRNKLWEIGVGESRLADPAWKAYNRLASPSGRRAFNWGAGLGTFAIAAVANDVPSAFMRSTDEGVGKLFRAAEQGFVYEGSFAATHALAGLARFRWAPGRFGLALGVGLGAAVVADRAVGECAELGGRGLSKVVRDLIAGRDPRVLR